MNFDRKVKKDVRHMGYALMAKAQVAKKNKHGQTVVEEKFTVVDTNLSRDEAVTLAKTKYSRSETRVVGVRMDFTPLSAPMSHKEKSNAQF